MYCHLFLWFTVYNKKNIAYHITEELIFYADKIMVMGTSKNSCVFNFAILLESRKFDAREIYMFYSTPGLTCNTKTSIYISISRQDKASQGMKQQGKALRTQCKVRQGSLLSRQTQDIFL